MNNVLIDDRRIFVDFSQSGESKYPVLHVIYNYGAATSVRKFSASQHQPAVHFAMLL